MEILLLFGVIGIILGTLLKLSVGVMKFLFGFTGIILAIILIPVAFALIVPLAIIGLGIGFLRLIF